MLTQSLGMRLAHTTLPESMCTTQPGSYSREIVSKATPPCSVIQHAGAEVRSLQELHTIHMNCDMGGALVVSAVKVGCCCWFNCESTLMYSTSGHKQDITSWTVCFEKHSLKPWINSINSWPGSLVFSAHSWLFKATAIQPAIHTAMITHLTVYISVYCVL